MMLRFIACVALCWSQLPVAVAQERISHGYFKEVRIFLPAPAQTPTGVVMFLSGQQGWTAPLTQLAGALTQQGALVAGIDLPQFLAAQRADGAECVFPDGDLENLSRYLQAYTRQPRYLPPLLVGQGEGASLAYALIAQGKPGTFAGALTLGFCDASDFGLPLCDAAHAHFQQTPKQRKLNLPSAAKLPAPWIELHRVPDAHCPTAQGFVRGTANARWVPLPQADTDAESLRALQQAYARFAVHAPAPAVRLPPGLAGLPVVEVAASGAGDDRFAIFLSGDGGWAGLDHEVAGVLAARGIPVVGLDSLRYFWTARTPQGLALDLDRLIQHYAARWRKSRVLLIGYSQGADVLPFGFNRLPAATRARVAQVVLLGLGQKATFEFHLSNWIGNSGDQPILPEALRLSPATALCIYGADDDQSLCPSLAARSVTAIALPGGHHFDGDYDKLAALILRRTDARP